MMTTTLHNEPQSVQEHFKDLSVLVEQGKAQGQNTAPPLQAYLSDHPELYAITSTLNKEVIRGFINYIANGNVTTRTLLSQDIQNRYEQFAETAALTPEILLLVEDTIIAYLSLRYADVMLQRHPTNFSALDLRRRDMDSVRLNRNLKTIKKLKGNASKITFHVQHVDFNQ